MLCGKWNERCFQEEGVINLVKCCLQVKRDANQGKIFCFSNVKVIGDIDIDSFNGAIG